MTRLFINLFFIVIICFTLAAMPINTKILEMFDFGDLFSKEQVETKDPEVDDLETFEAEFTFTLENMPENRLYNPSHLTLNLNTNITEAYEASYSLEDFELVLFRNNEIYQIFDSKKFVIESHKSYSDDFIDVSYKLDLSKSGLSLDQEGFYRAVLRAKSSQESFLSFDLAYLSDFNFVAPSEVSENYAYKAYFYNEAKTQVIPLSLHMNNPESITLALRNSLYQVPSEITGLAQQQVIPDRTSLSRISEGYYGVYLYSSTMADFINNEKDAELMIEALTKTMLTLPHINKLILYLDDRQVPGSFYDIDLSKTYEVDLSPKVYLPEESNGKTYLIPHSLNTTDTNEAIFEMISLLQNGLESHQMKQVLPAEVVLNNILMEASQVTLDFNKSFLDAYPKLENYQTLMIHSLLYSITSINGIETLSITIDGEALTDYGGFDFSAPVRPLKYINYVGQF